MMTMDSDNEIISQTMAWLNNVVIAHNFCPFARREVENKTIRYQVSQQEDIEHDLLWIMSELECLDKHQAVETTLLIFPVRYENFDDYLDMYAIANQLMSVQGYEGVYQLATFHPDYCFQGEAGDDAANYTNRSPYPLLHIIREASLEKALANYPQPESIPVNNIEHARQLGTVYFAELLKSFKGKV